MYAPGIIDCSTYFYDYFVRQLMQSKNVRHVSQVIRSNSQYISTNIGPFIIQVQFLLLIVEWELQAHIIYNIHMVFAVYISKKLVF